THEARLPALQASPEKVRRVLSRLRRLLLTPRVPMASVEGPRRERIRFSRSLSFFAQKQGARGPDRPAKPPAQQQRNPKNRGTVRVLGALPDWPASESAAAHGIVSSDVELYFSRHFS